MSTIRDTYTTDLILLMIGLFDEEYKLWSSSLCNLFYPLIAAFVLDPNSLLRSLFSSESLTAEREQVRKINNMSFPFLQLAIQVPSTVRVYGSCAGYTARPFLYSGSLRRLPRFLALAAQLSNILTVSTSIFFSYVRYQVSHPCRTKGNIVYIFICTYSLCVYVF
jgi:hypothetical protein